MKKNIPKYIGPEISRTSKKMTKQEIKDRFDKESAELYSQRKPAWLPEFDFAFSLIAQAIKPCMKPKAKIIDLGAGTGNLSRIIFEKYKDLRITLVDFSENMLKQVPNVLKDFSGTYEIARGDIFKIDFNKNAYNAVISSFAIHHGRGINTYKKLYMNIFRWLKKGGIFICCDVINGDNKNLSELNERCWALFLKNQDFTNSNIDKILNNYHREDTPLSINQHIKILNEIGFKSADVLWKKYNFGINIGIK